MRSLKTIVATVVIVFALTGVAMAGVQHFAGSKAQAVGGGQAKSTQVRVASVALPAPKAAPQARSQSGAPVDKASQGRAAQAAGAAHSHHAAQHTQRHAAGHHGGTAAGHSGSGHSGHHRHGGGSSGHDGHSDGHCGD